MGTSTVLIGIGISFIKISSDIPLVSTCSIAISAACHRPPEDREAHLLPVTWGVVSRETGEPVRCSLTTSKNVRPLMVGEKVSGEKLECDVDLVTAPINTSTSVRSVPDTSIRSEPV